jgi:Zn finger protein HypA/HybF involved in hydrogenase expression
MLKYKSSEVWDYTTDELKSIIEKHDYIKDVLLEIYNDASTAHYRTFSVRCEKDNIDLKYIKDRGVHKNSQKLSMSGFNKKIPLEDILVISSTYNRTELKNRLIKDDILANRCSNCGIEPKWDNKELVMILDHINGINNDHRLENLRLLCPNCNSQTSTFAGRQNTKPKKICLECGKILHRKNSSGYCGKCIVKYRKQYKKVQWPSPEQLAEEIKNMSWCAIGRKYGVSDNAVRKWARKYGLLK